MRGVGKGTIFVVEDDPNVCQMLSIVLSDAGYGISYFGDGEALLAESVQHSADCILLDNCLPGRSGLEILKQLRAQACTSPIIMISGQATIAVAVEALKYGAQDFIEKPFRGRDLVEHIDLVLSNATHEEPNGRRETSQIAPWNTSLTFREREVLDFVIAGRTSKEAGRLLNISARTVEYHRAKILQKFDLRNTTELVRLLLARPDGSADKLPRETEMKKCC